jgi:hypothetical protein
MAALIWFSGVPGWDKENQPAFIDFICIGIDGTPTVWSGGVTPIDFFNEWTVVVLPIEHIADTSNQVRSRLGLVFPSFGFFSRQSISCADRHGSAGSNVKPSPSISGRVLDRCEAGLFFSFQDIYIEAENKLGMWVSENCHALPTVDHIETYNHANNGISLKRRDAFYRGNVNNGSLLIPHFPQLALGGSSRSLEIPGLFLHFPKFAGQSFDFSIRIVGLPLGLISELGDCSDSNLNILSVASDDSHENSRDSHYNRGKGVNDLHPSYFPPPRFVGWCLLWIGVALFGGAYLWIAVAAREGLTIGDTGWRGFWAIGFIAAGLFLFWQAAPLLLTR